MYLFPGDSKSGKSYEVNDHDLADVDEYLRHSIDDEDAPDYEDYFDYFNHVVESQKIVTWKDSWVDARALYLYLIQNAVWTFKCDLK